MEALLGYGSEGSEGAEPVLKRARSEAARCAWTRARIRPASAIAHPCFSQPLAAAACRPAAAAAAPPLLPPADALLDGSYSPPPAAAQRALEQAVLHQASAAGAAAQQCWARAPALASLRPCWCALCGSRTWQCSPPNAPLQRPAVQGRARAFPHVTGNFATHVYVEGALWHELGARAGCLTAPAAQLPSPGCVRGSSPAQAGRRLMVLKQ